MNSREWSMFRKCYSGLLKYKKLGSGCIFITLTSSDVATDNLDNVDILKCIKINFDVLRKRFEVDFNKDFGEYFRVSTLEGNGVIHIVVNNEFISHDWLVENWNEIHGSHIVDVRSLDDNCFDSAKYIISQYVSCQDGKKIFGYSHNWVYVGFVNDLKEALRSSRDFVHDPKRILVNGYPVEYFPVRYDYFNVLWSIYLDYRLNGKNPEFWRLSPQVNAVLDGNKLLMTSVGGLLQKKN